MSRALPNPRRMLRPVTADVMDPRLMAASAVVEMCPTEMTGTNTRLYSTIDALISKMSVLPLKCDWGTDPKMGSV